MLLSDLFNPNSGILNNPQMAQALSAALLQAAQPSTTPQSAGNAVMQAMQAAQQQQQMQDILKQRQMQQPSGVPFSQTYSVNNPTVSPGQAFNINFPSDKGELLAQLKQQAETAFPNNPTMQQVALTQAIHEGGLMGSPSTLAKQGNLFGIKAPGSAGSINMDTGEYASGIPYRTTAAFGANANIGDSFNQYRDLLSKDRYGAVRQAQTPVDAFSALQKAGYATDPQYSRKLNRVYNQYIAPLYM